MVGDGGGGRATFNGILIYASGGYSYTWGVFAGNACTHGLTSSARLSWITACASYINNLLLAHAWGGTDCEAATEGLWMYDVS